MLSRVQPLYRGKDALVSRERRLAAQQALAQGDLDKALALASQAVLRAPMTGNFLYTHNQNTCKKTTLLITDTKSNYTSRKSAYGSAQRIFASHENFVKIANALVLQDTLTIASETHSSIVKNGLHAKQYTQTYIDF